MCRPTLWFLAARVVGMTVAMPLYCAVYTVASNPESYWWPLRQGVHDRHHTLVFHVLTCFSILIPGDGQRHLWDSLLQGFIFAWAARILGYAKTRPEVLDGARQGGLGMVLRRIYAAVSCLSALLYWYILVQIRGHMECLRFILGGAVSLKYLCGFVLVPYVWCVSAVWDMKRVGRARISTPVAAAAVLIAFLGIGPGATMAAVWAWREEAMAAVFVGGKKER